MILVEYEVACRSCMNADNFGHSFMFDGKAEYFFEKGIMKSEYITAQNILTILDKGEDACDHCGSTNLEISNIEIDGKSPNINPNATQFKLFISTTPSGDVAIKNRGHQYIPPGFLPEAFELIEKIISEIPANKFEEKNTGHIHFTVSTININNTSDRRNQLEHLSFAGFSEQQIAKFISIARNHYIK